MLELCNGFIMIMKDIAKQEILEIGNILPLKKNNIGKPKIDGINDVRELLPLIKLTATPQIIKNIP